MYNSEITISQTLFDDLYAAQQELNKKKQLLSEIETKKAQRAESYKRSRKISPEEKKFGEILRSANRKLKSQVFQDSSTLNRIIKQKIGDNEEHMFYATFKNRVDAVIGTREFGHLCSQNKLNTDAIAQHVVIHGNKAMNNVFKYGLGHVYKPEQLLLMNKAVFTTVELNLDQYLPEKHPEEANAE